MVKVDIVLDNARIFLFPASVPLASGSRHIAPPDDTTVRGELVISSQDKVRIGPVRVVWEVARESKMQEGKWGKRDVLARFESEVTTDDLWVESVETRLLFTFQIPSLLPPTTETAFDRTSHTLVASILESAPEYSAELAPSYYDLVSRPSITSLSDWSFPSNASRRSSLLTDHTGSRGSSISSRRPSISIEGDSDWSRRSSLAISSPLAGNVTEVKVEPKKQKKSGLLSGFRRKATTASQSTSQATEAGMQPAAPTYDGIEIAEWLMPSTARSARALEIISCPAAKGEICTVDWSKKSHTAGLGDAERYIHSSIFSLGSGINFDYNVSDIPASSTIHNIRLSLCQTTKAANGDQEDTVFTLFSRGSSPDGQHVWRGEVARSWDAQISKAKFGKGTPMGPVPQASLLGVATGPSSLRIRTKARLPTPINGAVPTSPRLLDNRLARVTHHIRIEAYYSVLGEDASGSALPTNPKSKDGRPQEGTIRRTWVDHEVVIGACCITPENILVPTYSPSTAIPAESAQGRLNTESRTNLESFDMLSTSTQAIQRTEVFRFTETRQSPPLDSRELLARHAHTNGSRCLCFQPDSVVAELVGSLDKPIPDQSNPLEMVDIGGIVKSLYISAIDRVDIMRSEEAREDACRQVHTVVACL